MTPIRAAAPNIAGSLPAADERAAPIIVLQALLRAASMRIFCMKGYSRSAAEAARLLLVPLLAGFFAEGWCADPWRRHLASRTILEAFDSG